MPKICRKKEFLCREAQNLNGSHRVTIQWKMLWNGFFITAWMGRENPIGDALRNTCLLFYYMLEYKGNQSLIDTYAVMSILRMLTCAYYNVSIFNTWTVQFLYLSYSLHALWPTNWLSPEPPHSLLLYYNSTHSFQLVVKVTQLKIEK